MVTPASLLHNHSNHLPMNVPKYTKVDSREQMMFSSYMTTEVPEKENDPARQHICRIITLL